MTDVIDIFDNLVIKIKEEPKKRKPRGPRKPKQLTRKPALMIKDSKGNLQHTCMIKCGKAMHHIAIVNNNVVLLNHPSREDDKAMQALSGEGHLSLAESFKCYEILDIWANWNTTTKKHTVPIGLYWCREEMKPHHPFRKLNKLLKDSMRGMRDTFDYLDPYSGMYAKDARYQRQTDTLEDICERNIVQALNNYFLLKHKLRNSNDAPWPRHFPERVKSFTVKDTKKSADYLKLSFLYRATDYNWDVALSVNVRKWLQTVYKKVYPIVNDWLILSMNWVDPFYVGVGRGIDLANLNNSFEYTYTHEWTSQTLAMVKDGSNWVTQKVQLS